MHLRLIHFCTCKIKCSILYIAEHSPITWMHHGCSAIHQLKKMGCFPCEAIMSKTAMNILIIGFYLNIKRFTWIAELYGECMFNFITNHQMLSKVHIPLCIPNLQCMRVLITPYILKWYGCYF